MRRKKYQKGSLQLKDHGHRMMWILQYRVDGSKKYHTLGSKSEMTKSQAQQMQAEIMSKVNLQNVVGAADPEMTFGQFVDGVALPVLRSKWKLSTEMTTGSRMSRHLAEFREAPIRNLTRGDLQAFLERKAETLSRSMVAHLRWDLGIIFKLALGEGVIDRDPTTSLFVPKVAISKPKFVMTRKEVKQYLGVLETREKIVAQLAIFAGMRPGEILGLQRQHVSGDCTAVMVVQRVYRGDIGTPKTKSSERDAAVPSRTAALLKEWMGLVPNSPSAWVFASENPETPIWRDNMLERSMKPKLKPVGLDWATFQVLRRTHASLGHEAGVDPKVAADQRGHGIDVALNVYTKIGLKKRAEAAEKLEESVLAADGVEEEKEAAEQLEKSVFES